jgi:hypothetical protein
MFIITDWCSNVLQYNGKFNFSAYGADTGVPMKFKTFDDAWEYLHEKYDDESLEEFHVEEMKGE